MTGVATFHRSMPEFKSGPHFLFKVHLGRQVMMGQELSFLSEFLAPCFGSGLVIVGIWGVELWIFLSFSLSLFPFSLSLCLSDKKIT